MAVAAWEARAIVCIVRGTWMGWRDLDLARATLYKRTVIIRVVCKYYPLTRCDFVAGFSDSVAARGSASPHGASGRARAAHRTVEAPAGPAVRATQLARLIGPRCRDIVAQIVAEVRDEGGEQRDELRVELALLRGEKQVIGAQSERLLELGRGLVERKVAKDHEE